MNVTTETATELKYEEYEFDPRYYIHTAKSNVTSFAHVIAEAVSNSDESISRRAARDGQPDRGTIHIAYDPDGMDLVVTDDGDGMTTERMRGRLKRVGAEAAPDARRGFFHRGIREVFIAMGASTVESIGIRSGKSVYSKAVFHPTDGMPIVASDVDVSDALHAELGIEATGTRLTIPMKRLAAAKGKQFTFPALEAQIQNCVQVRPVLADGNRNVAFEYGDAPPRKMRFSYPTGDVLVPEGAVTIAGFVGTLWAKASAGPIKGGGISRQTRRHGILIRGERAAYEVSLGSSLHTYPAVQQLCGELRIDGIEKAQREADARASDEAELIYKADRSGLNPDHPLVEAVHQFLDKTFGPLLAALETKENKKTVSADIRRQLNQLARLINDVVDDRDFGDAESSNGKPKREVEPTPSEQEPPEPPTGKQLPEIPDGIAFAYDRVFVAAGKSRTVKVWVDTGKIASGTPIGVESSGEAVVHAVTLSATIVPTAPTHGIAELSLTIQAEEAEGRREVKVSSGGYSATLPVHVRFLRASGFISQIVPVDKDWESGSALYDPATGRVNVYVGRPEFVDAAKRARKEKIKDPFGSPLYRQLIAESVREAALRTAAERRAEVAWDDLPYEERQERDAFSKLVVVEYHALDYRLRHSLLHAFVYA